MEQHGNCRGPRRHLQGLARSYAMLTVMPSPTPYRGSDPSYNWDAFYDLPIRRFGNLESLNIDHDRHTRYIVDMGSIHLDFTVNPKGGKTLLVGFHGLENRKDTQLPKFQNVRSFGLRNESSMFLFDTTLLHNETLTLGWMFGTSKDSLTQLYAEAIHAVRESLGCPLALLFGHSGGGFAAMRVGTHLENSHAISVNGQVVVGHHRPWTIEALAMAVGFEGTLSEFLETWGEARLDLRSSLDKRADNSTFTYFGHREDRLCMTLHPHYPLLAGWADLTLEGGRTPQGDSLVPCIWSSSNPNPHAMPGSALPFIRLTLGEDPKIDIQYSVDPKWEHA